MAKNEAKREDWTVKSGPPSAARVSEDNPTRPGGSRKRPPFRARGAQTGAPTPRVPTEKLSAPLAVPKESLSPPPRVLRIIFAATGDGREPVFPSPGEPEGVVSAPTGAGGEIIFTFAGAKGRGNFSSQDIERGIVFDSRDTGTGTFQASRGLPFSRDSGSCPDARAGVRRAA